MVLSFSFFANFPPILVQFFRLLLFYAFIFLIRFECQVFLSMCITNIFSQFLLWKFLIIKDFSIVKQINLFYKFCASMPYWISTCKLLWSDKNIFNTVLNFKVLFVFFNSFNSLTLILLVIWRRNQSLLWNIMNHQILFLKSTDF